MINNVKGSIKEQIKRRLVAVYSGKPWYGKSVSSILEMSEGELPEGALRILNHMIAWRKFIIAVLQQEEYKIEINSEQDWPPVIEKTSKIKEHFAHSQNELINAIEQVNPDDWMSQPEGAKFSLFELCEGVIDHDIYHAGQIALLVKEG